MKKILIILLLLVVGAAVAVWLSRASEVSIGGVSQNVEKPASVAGSRYEDPSGFSFERPDGYEIRSIADENGKTILVEKGGSGFQIVVTPYDEPASGFTVARIKKDLPDLVMKDAKEFELAGGRGVMFDSDPDREIWFVVIDTLYQVSAPQSEAANAERAVATFRKE